MRNKKKVKRKRTRKVDRQKRAEQLYSVINKVIQETRQTPVLVSPGVVRLGGVPKHV